MRFQVYGVREDTGRPIKPVVVKAADEQSARIRAQRAGIRVERIDPLQDEKASEPPHIPATAAVATSPPVTQPVPEGLSCRRCQRRVSFWSNIGRDVLDKGLCEVCGMDTRREAAQQQAEAERVRREQAAQTRKLPVGPPQWRYQMAQIPTQISVQADGLAGGPAAAYLERVVQEHAALGWEFYRIDEVGVQEPVS